MVNSWVPASNLPEPAVASFIKRVRLIRYNGHSSDPYKLISGKGTSGGLTPLLLDTAFFLENFEMSPFAINYLFLPFSDIIDEALENYFSSIGSNMSEQACFNIVDYGCADGSNSVEIFEKIVTRLRKISPGKPVHVFCNDLENSKWNLLEGRMKALKLKVIIDSICSFAMFFFAAKGNVPISPKYREFSQNHTVTFITAVCTGT